MNERNFLIDADTGISTVSTFAFQPENWLYEYPARWGQADRALVPPKALPWFYTCDAMYLLGWLALRVFAVEAVVAAAYYGLRALS